MGAELSLSKAESSSKLEQEYIYNLQQQVYLQELELKFVKQQKASNTFDASTSEPVDASLHNIKGTYKHMEADFAKRLEQEEAHQSELREEALRAVMHEKRAHADDCDEDDERSPEADEALKRVRNDRTDGAAAFFDGRAAHERKVAGHEMEEGDRAEEEDDHTTHRASVVVLRDDADQGEASDSERERDGKRPHAKDEGRRIGGGTADGPGQIKEG